MDRQEVDKILKEYKFVLDLNDMYRVANKKGSKIKNYDNRKYIVDVVETALTKLSDDQLFIMTKKYNLEDEAYLRKYGIGEVPDNEIMEMEEFDYAKMTYFRKKKKAYKKLGKLLECLSDYTEWLDFFRVSC